MPDLYDDEIVQTAVKATRRVKGGTIVGLLVENEIRLALAAVAPAIAAKALRRVGMETGSITDEGLFRLADEIEGKA